MKIMPETRLGNMFTVGLGMAIGAAGVAALIMGLISLFKKGGRSFLAFLSLAVGLYALLFLSFLVWLTFFGGSLIHLNF